MLSILVPLFVSLGIVYSVNAGAEFLLTLLRS